jgi:hypothetical protein
MSATSFLQVLAVLHDNERESTAVLERAIELADVERARLTIAKTTDPGRLVRWCGPMAAISRPAPMIDPDQRDFAARRLACLAELVPASIPLRTQVLGPDTTCAVRRLIAGGSYDLLVIGAKSLFRDFRLRRELRHLDVCVLAVSPNPIAEGELRPEHSRAVDGVGADVLQITAS